MQIICARAVPQQCEETAAYAFVIAALGGDDSYYEMWATCQTHLGTAMEYMPTTLKDGTVAVIKIQTLSVGEALLQVKDTADAE